MKRRWVVLGMGMILFLIVPFLSQGAEDKSAALQRLYEAAKKEGQLVLFDGTTIEEITQVIQVFEKRYPGIKVQANVASDSSLFSRRLPIMPTANHRFHRLTITVRCRAHP